MALFYDEQILTQRLKWIKAVFVVVFLLLFAKLWYVTVLSFERYQALAERNHVRQVPKIAARGLIYDRKGRILVDNVSSTDLILYSQELQHVEETFDFLKRGLQLNPNLLLERIEMARQTPYYQTVVLKRNLSIDEISYILSHQTDHPELGIEQRPRRIYRYGPLAAHAMGYVGEVTKEQLSQPSFRDKKPGDIIGKYGLENEYDTKLTGRDGWCREIVDSRGRPLEHIDCADPVRGSDLSLTVDLELQQTAEAAFENAQGAIVALDPRSGAILALASHPTFDPNQFAVPMPIKDWDAIVENPLNPLQNRATQSIFSPGSIFKIVVALAGLEHNLIDEHSTVNCRGGGMFYGRWFRCWKAEGHGQVTLREALAHSCNVFFYELGRKLSIDQIAQMSRKLGLGSQTGVDLVGEADGLIPSTTWKKNERGEPWYPGETISVSIGQGPVNVTPLQLARAVGIVATGRAVVPHLVAPVPEPPPISIQFDQDYFALVREGMCQSVNGGGTGYGAYLKEMVVCGKTGTAQVVSLMAKKQLEGSDLYEPHAWFVGFAPRENPEIVVAVIVQQGGSGGSVAAPIAGRLLKRYAELKAESPNPVTMAGSRTSVQSSSVVQD